MSRFIAMGNLNVTCKPCEMMSLTEFKIRYNFKCLSEDHILEVSKPQPSSDIEKSLISQRNRKASV